MGRDSDRSFKIAAALLGAVIFGLVVIAAARIHAAGGIENALDDDRGWGGLPYGERVDDCIAYAERLANGPNPWDGELSSSGDRQTETVDGHERGWSLNVSTYSDEAAAARALEVFRLLDSPEGAACSEDGVKLVAFPGSVPNGYGVGEISSDDGDSEQLFTAVWRENDRLMTLTLWTNSMADVSGWVRDELTIARERSRHTASR